MNLTELAKLANVSVSTASKALSGCFDVSDDTRKLVTELAKKHGCFEKYHKPKYEKQIIAVICPEMLGIHYGSMATYIENAVTKAGGTTLMSVSNFSPALQNELVDYYSRFVRASGIIVIDPVGKIKYDGDIPIVQIGSGEDCDNIDIVDVDSKTATVKAMNYAAKTANSSIGFIGERLASPELEYFNYAAKKNNITINPGHVIISDLRFYDAGYYSVDKMIKENSLPGVLFAAYSHIAVGILQRLKEERLSVPGDISLICMDNIISAPYTDISLACIVNPLEELCNIALDLIFNKMKKNYGNLHQRITVTRTFEKGMSVGKKTGC